VTSRPSRASLVLRFILRFSNPVAHTLTSLPPCLLRARVCLLILLRPPNLTCFALGFDFRTHLDGRKVFRGVQVRVGQSSRSFFFFAATGKQLAFKAWDVNGWLVTVSGDMEVAPWIGMARSFIKRMDADKRPTVDEFLSKVLRVCHRHAVEYVCQL